MGTPAIKYDKYSYSDYASWDDSERWELINGYPSNMSPAPSRIHQRIAGELFNSLKNYLEGKSCEVYIAPFDVRLAEIGEPINFASNVVQPDISVICNPSKLDDKGAIGAPDLIIEVLSPSTLKNDTKEKFALYERFGVKEYWIVDPDQQTISNYVLGSNGKYSLLKKHFTSDKLITNQFPGLEINLKKVFGS
jgi:Uma2 family endonuclease